MKNQQNARILVNICVKNYQNTRMFAICPKNLSMCPPPRPLSCAYMFYSVSVYCVLCPCNGVHGMKKILYFNVFSSVFLFLRKLPY